MSRASRLLALCTALVAAPTLVMGSGWADVPAQEASAQGLTANAAGAVDLKAVARELIAACPVADPGDAKARDNAGAALARSAALLKSCGDTILWGGFDPLQGHDPRTYTQTRFAPLVWARLYLSQFMFTGEYEILDVPPFKVLELKAGFRKNLDSGDYPYPLWHSAKKWQAHLNVESIMVIAEGGEIIGAFRKTRPDPGLPDKRWDGRWHWTDEGGTAQPRVALYEYLLSADNPHRSGLEASYRKLEEQVRGQGCVSCHAPDNAGKANPLTLLLYPNQALGARHFLVDSLKNNDMPPEDLATGAKAGISDEKVRQGMLATAEEFARLGDQALAFEMQSVKDAPRPSAPDAKTAAPDGKPATAPAWKVISDDWYSLTLAGVHSGWMRVAREDDGKRYRTVNEMSLHSKIAGTSLDVESYVEWVELHDGTPLRLSIAEKNKEKLTNFDIGSYSAWEKTRDGDPLGLLVTQRAWEFDGAKATKVVVLDGKERRYPGVTPEGPWLPPAAAQRFIQARLADSARAIEYGSVDAADTLRYITVRSTLIGNKDFALEGTMVPVTVWRTQTTVNPGQSWSHYSRDGKLMYSSNDIGVGLLETRRVPRDEAKPKAEAAKLAAEVQVYPVIKPDRPLASRSRAVYEIKAISGKLPPLPSAGIQVVTVSPDGTSATVLVDRAKPSQATSAEQLDAKLRERSPVAGEDSRKTLELAARTMREAQGIGEGELAAAARIVVHNEFKERQPADPALPMNANSARYKDSGREAAQLLAAILRVHRIPGRVVSGLAYAAQPNGEGAFEWRFWTQAMVDGRWVDLDPALTEPMGADHILTGFSVSGALHEDPDPAKVAEALNRLQVRILNQE